MHAEFEAYVHALTAGDCRTKTSPSPLSEIGKTLMALFTDLLDAAAPYYCELRPIKRVRGAIAKCCAPKQAIGYHGLA